MGCVRRLEPGTFISRNLYRENVLYYSLLQVEPEFQGTGGSFLPVLGLLATKQRRGSLRTPRKRLCRRRNGLKIQGLSLVNIDRENFLYSQRLRVPDTTGGLVNPDRGVGSGLRVALPAEVGLHRS